VGVSERKKKQEKEKEEIHSLLKALLWRRATSIVVCVCRGAATTGGVCLASSPGRVKALRNDTGTSCCAALL
jgi:hypothetical protein